MPLSSQQDPTQWSAPLRRRQQVASADEVTAPWAAVATGDALRYRRHSISYSAIAMDPHFYSTFLDHPFGHHDQPHHELDMDLAHPDFPGYFSHNLDLNTLALYQPPETVTPMATWQVSSSIQRHVAPLSHEPNNTEKGCMTSALSTGSETLAVMPMPLHYPVLPPSVSSSVLQTTPVVCTSAYDGFQSLAISTPLSVYTPAPSQSSPGPLLTTSDSNDMLPHPYSKEAVSNIRLYLDAHDPAAVGERTAVIMTSKVAQKSYGTEKRFLCPPPTTILVGEHWWSRYTGKTEPGEASAQFALAENETCVVLPPKITAAISSCDVSAYVPGQIEWSSQCGSIIGQTGNVATSHQRLQPLHLLSNPCRFSTGEGTPVDGEWFHNPRQEPVGGGKCVSKQMYIQDVHEKRKRVQCLARVNLADQSLLGIFPSKDIKVISKPTKKRQSTKNTELCIYHGSAVSLFNRIRAQTVSTRYLAVSTHQSDFLYPGRGGCNSPKVAEGTCFIARSNAWDPFVIWIVDTSQTQPHDACAPAQDYIGRGMFAPTMGLSYPPPPKLAVKNTGSQPLAVHYNQQIVLQCLTTGLVSPVMVIRRVDYGTTVVGGQKVDAGAYGYPSTLGTAATDEALGDPVSQLHKIGLEVVQDACHSDRADLSLDNSAVPQNGLSTKYLACHNDMVGIHDITDTRRPRLASTARNQIKLGRKRRATTIHYPVQRPIPDLDRPLAREVALSEENETVAPMTYQKRTSSAHDFQSLHRPPVYPHQPRARSYSTQETTMRRYSLESSTSTLFSNSSSTSSSSSTSPLDRDTISPGSYWSEDISESAVWTIVGTDIAMHTFWTAPCKASPPPTTPLLFPILSHYTLGTARKDQRPTQDEAQKQALHLHGEHLSRELHVWFGDIPSQHCVCRSRELLVCSLPPRQTLLGSVYIQRNQDSMTLPILLVRGQGDLVHKTGVSLRF